MTKYRGKNNGQTRGQYQEAVLFHNTRGPNVTDKFFFDVVGFLSDYGVSTNLVTHYHNDCFSERTGTYHIGGSTAGLSSRSYKKKDKPDFPKNFVQLHLISNDCLDDVVQYISKHFPVFKEIAPHKRY